MDRALRRRRSRFTAGLAADLALEAGGFAATDLRAFFADVVFFVGTRLRFCAGLFCVGFSGELKLSLAAVASFSLSLIASLSGSAGGAFHGETYSKKFLTTLKDTHSVMRGAIDMRVSQ